MYALKRFGQNFLQSGAILKKISEAVECRPGEALLEVGPGEGGLTQLLADRSISFTAVEIDIRLVKHLQRRFQDQPEVAIEHGDILRTDLFERAGGQPRLVLAGNIPFNITHMLLLHILKSKAAVSRAYLMVQKEVAERICSPAGVKSYSFMAAVVQTFYTPQQLFTVDPEAFRPRPLVHAAFLRLEAHDTYAARIDNRNKYIRLVSNAFSQRRKKVVNVLTRFYPKDQVKAFFAAQGLDENLRAENLTVENYVELFQHLREIVAPAA